VFVDGVRRVELRLIAEDGPRRAPGLFGSYAVGSVRCEGRAAFADHGVGRALVVGGGLLASRVALGIGRAVLVFEPITEPSTEPDRPIWRLQQLMREAEGNLAARAAAEHECLVLMDGPLTFRDPTRAPVVGVVKRSSRNYLPPDQEGLLTRLETGQRTPLFAVGDEEQPVQRYAWYARLAEFSAPWHDHAGLVRCEVRAGIGLGSAIELGDQVTAVLPRYAGRPGDPRAPQNLAPVAGLERWLRHRMGDRGLVRRGLVSWIASSSRVGERAATA
jgi:hypothetical protein